MLAALLLVALSTSASADAPPQAPPPRGSFMPVYRSACISSLREFAYALSSAVESGDVNRVATLYRWQGLSTQAGYDTMTQLQAIVSRPLLQVTPVYPRPREPEFALADPDPTQSAPDASAPSAYGQPGTATADPGPKVFPPLTGPPIWDVPLPRNPPATADPGLSAVAPPDPREDARPRSPPWGLRLDQTLANGVTPSTTTFRLQRDLGCWWISL